MVFFFSFDLDVSILCFEATETRGAAPDPSISEQMPVIGRAVVLHFSTKHISMIDYYFNET